MKIETIRLSELSADPANARKHPERNLDSIIASLHRFGQQKPIVIDKSNVVRAGNGTFAAAKAIGWETIECIRTELESTEAIAYAIADNRTAELAEWDEDVLLSLLEGLSEDSQLEGVGFNESEVKRMLDVMAGHQADLLDEWKDGMPEYDGSPVGSSTLIVHFASEDDRQEFAKLVSQEIKPKAKYIWYPRKPD